MAEKLRSVVGIQCLRCRKCGYRFTDHPWRLRYLIYAHCPKCRNMVLRNWSEKYFYPPWYKRWLRRIGAREQRCEACRYNFVSFRKRWKAKKNGPK